jgi:sulfite reductase (ferredoxin)
MMAKVNVEQIKADSAGLRGSIGDELATPTRQFTDAAEKILKFHGIYQQEDRDARKVDRTADHHQFMIRTKIPGGQMTAAQYLAHDDLAGAYGNETLRITTRECFQLHGVLKGDLRPTLQALHGALVTSLGACGDIVRNVMACPAPTADPARRAVQAFAHELTRALFPRTSAYHQIWIDGEEMIADEVIEEPLYGNTYLPRKFKIAIAYAGDNCVDVFTNDIGLVALFDEQNALIGFNFLAGGGMGMTHQNDATYARLADVIGFITPDQVVRAVQASVTIHRDFGDRENRKHARLKYILHERGAAWFRAELEARAGFALGDPRPMPTFGVDDHLGWGDQGDGRWFIGIPVENGRIVDRGAYRLRTGLRAIIERFQPAIRLTAQQNILLTDIAPEDRASVDAALSEYGIVTVDRISNARRRALACPALPTCGLAITEAERAMPGVIDELEEALSALGIPEADITARMTGCPNGCARPYVAEIAFVGRSLDKYTIFLGGAPNGTRLALPFADLIPTRDLVPTLIPVLARWRDERHADEAFGDYVMRIGIESLQASDAPKALAGD